MQICKVFTLQITAMIVVMSGLYWWNVYKFWRDVPIGVENSEIDVNPIINFETETEFQVVKINVEDLQYSVIVGTPQTVKYENDVIVFVHGFPDNFHSFSHQMRAFVEKGYRVYSPEIRGYELSTIPENGDYRLVAAAKDFLGVLKGLGLTQNIHAMGHDWGSIIVNLAAKASPETFKTIGLFSVAEPKEFFKYSLIQKQEQFLRSWYVWVNQLPWLPEWILKGSNDEFTNFKYYLSKWYDSYNPARVDSVIETLKQPGVLSAAIGYYRAIMPVVPIFRLVTGIATEEEQREFAVVQSAVQVPTLAIAPTHDTTYCQELFELTINETNFTGGFELEFMDTNHFIQHEKPDEVTQLIEAFVQKHH